MKATFNQIVENLVKVLTDKAESAQYYSSNEQYTGICGWCGVMSPESRPAYIKTFGKETTEQAEAKAREIIAEKEAARQRTKYAQHAQEADRLEGVPAVGGFFWADNSGLKCDGGRGLFEELQVARVVEEHAAHDFGQDVLGRACDASVVEQVAVTCVGMGEERVGQPARHGVLVEAR